MASCPKFKPWLCKRLTIANKVSWAGGLQLVLEIPLEHLNIYSLREFKILSPIRSVHTTSEDQERRSVDYNIWRTSRAFLSQTTSFRFHTLPQRNDRYKRTDRCNRDGSLVHMIRSNIPSGLTPSASMWSRGVRREDSRGTKRLAETLEGGRPFQSVFDLIKCAINASSFFEVGITCPPKCRTTSGCFPSST